MSDSVMAEGYPPHMVYDYRLYNVDSTAAALRTTLLDALVNTVPIFIRDEESHITIVRAALDSLNNEKTEKGKLKINRKPGQDYRGYIDDVYNWVRDKEPYQLCLASSSIVGRERVFKSLYVLHREGLLDPETRREFQNSLIGRIAEVLQDKGLDIEDRQGIIWGVIVDEDIVAALHGNLKELKKP